MVSDAFCLQCSCPNNPSLISREFIKPKLSQLGSLPSGLSPPGSRFHPPSKDVLDTVLRPPVLSPFLNFHLCDLTCNEENTPEVAKEKGVMPWLSLPGSERAPAASLPFELNWLVELEDTKLRQVYRCTQLGQVNQTSGKWVSSVFVFGDKFLHVQPNVYITLTDPVRLNWKTRVSNMNIPSNTLWNILPSTSCLTFPYKYVCMGEKCCMFLKYGFLFANVLLASFPESIKLIFSATTVL